MASTRFDGVYQTSFMVEDVSGAEVDSDAWRGGIASAYASSLFQSYPLPHELEELAMLD